MSGGYVEDSDRLVAFIYLLMRDSVPVGEIAKHVADIEKMQLPALFDNEDFKFLAQGYANRILDWKS